MENAAEGPLVVGIGGTARPGSTTDRALRIALEAARASGARTMCFGGHFIAGLPIFEPQSPIRTPDTRRFLQAVRAADGVLVASPGYHGGLSGVVKNALDFLEDLRDDDRPYLDGRAVGCIVTAYGWQGAGTTLTSVRTIVHALRGWPTPLGVTLNTAIPLFDSQGHCTDERVQIQFEMLAAQVVEFARRFRA
jgi:FMN reductase